MRLPWFRRRARARSRRIPTVLRNSDGLISCRTLLVDRLYRANDPAEILNIFAIMGLSSELLAPALGGEVSIEVVEIWRDDLKRPSEARIQQLYNLRDGVLYLLQASSRSFQQIADWCCEHQPIQKCSLIRLMVEGRFIEFLDAADLQPAE